MSVKITVDRNSAKESRYVEIIPQIESLVSGESNSIANLSNVASALKYSFDNFLWVGFYLYDEISDELVLGPFQGRVACTRIKMGKGVCGTSAEKKETIIVEDVNKFPGHLFCDMCSKSEIVVPVIKDGGLEGVLDIDSDVYSNFDLTDKKYLDTLVNKISKLF